MLSIETVDTRKSCQAKSTARTATSVTKTTGDMGSCVELLKRRTRNCRRNSFRNELALWHGIGASGGRPSAGRDESPAGTAIHAHSGTSLCTNVWRGATIRAFGARVAVQEGGFVESYTAAQLADPSATTDNNELRCRADDASRSRSTWDRSLRERRPADDSFRNEFALWHDDGAGRPSCRDALRCSRATPGRRRRPRPGLGIARPPCSPEAGLAARHPPRLRR